MTSTVTLISSSPSVRAESVDARSNIVLTFSGPVKAGAGKFEILDRSDRTLVSEPMSGSHVTISGNTVTIDPPRDLPYLSSIKLVFTGDWLLDSSGAAISTPSDFIFWTGMSATALDMQGTDMADILHGSDLVDRLDGGAGNDEIGGFGGNDVLAGGLGDDSVWGGDGDDLLLGGDGNDFLQGNEGNDVLEGGAGDDELRDFAGNDTLSGGDGNDRIYSWGPGRSFIDGGRGDDSIIARQSDIVAAGDGNDIIQLQLLSDSTDGRVDGGAGDDRFEIGLLTGTSGSINLTGGSGRDTYVLQLSRNHEGVGAGRGEITDFAAGVRGDQIDLAPLIIDYQYKHGYNTGNPFAPGGFVRLQSDGADTLLLLLEDGERTLLRLKNVQPQQLTGDNFVGGYRPDGGSQGLSLQGTGANDVLTGYEVDDQLMGGHGDDVLDGAGGNDVLRGGAGVDELLGGYGDDVLDGGTGNDVLRDYSGRNTLRGGAGNDSLSVGGTDFVAEGDDGDDIIYAGGNGRVSGGNGNDVLRAAAGAMLILDGGSGNDTIDITGIFGGAIVTASGGSGRDVFNVGNVAPNRVTVSDFTTGAGGDLIDVSGVMPYSPNGNPFGTGHLRLRQEGLDTILEFSWAGAAGSGTDWRDIATFSNTNAADFTRDNFLHGISPDGGNEGPTLVGGSGNDELRGQFLNDLLEGNDGNDQLYGGFGNDVLRGGNGDDMLDGGGGDDLLDGGAGFDVVQLARKRFDFKIWVENGSFKVQDLQGLSGTDTLQGIERLQLDGTTVAFDGNGVGGQVYRLYQAAFDRAPDQVGMGFWIHHADRGQDLVSIAEAFVTSAEFKTLYGAAPTNAEVIDRLYYNVLHRAPDAEGRAFWLDVLDRKLAPLSSVLVGFSESKENVANLAEVIGKGFDYTTWYG